jgi:hypothetical protein
VRSLYTAHFQGKDFAHPFAHCSDDEPSQGDGAALLGEEVPMAGPVGGLGRTLLLAAALAALPSCFGVSGNPSYFPHLNPVRTQHVLIATVYDAQGRPRPD